MSSNINVELVRHRAREIRESLDKIRAYKSFNPDGSLSQHPSASLLAS